MLPDLNTLVNSVAEKVSHFNILDCALPKEFTGNVVSIFSSSVEFGNSSSLITNRNGQHIFLSNNWFYIAAMLAPLYKPFYNYKNLVNQIVDKDALKQSNNERIISAINNSSLLDSQQDKDLLIKFATDPLWWNGGNSNTGGKTLDRNDALVSSILSIANLVNSSQSYVATLWEFFGQNPDYAILLDNVASNLIEKNALSVSIRVYGNGNQKIFFGTPGSGKSFHVSGIVDGHEKFTFRTTFHPDYDYASFVGTYKPVKDEEKGELTYSFIPQSFTNAYVTA